MVVIRLDNLLDFKIDDKISVCIGNFDGIHFAHQMLIKKLNDFNKKKCVITFDPHPHFFDVDYRFLTDTYDKIKIIEEFKVDYLIIINFTNIIKESTALDFINFLKNINTVNVCCGFNFYFGKNKEGNTTLLKKYFNVFILDKIVVSNYVVSSSTIKNLITNNNIALANQLLTRSYFIKGVVVHGKKLGRELGFPTLNLDIKRYVIPSTGVYATRVLIDNKIYYSATNVGYNPSFDDNKNIKIEVNVFDFNLDVYGKEVTLYFDKKIRNEKKFNSKDEFISELNNNIVEIKKFYMGGK